MENNIELFLLKHFTIPPDKRPNGECAICTQAGLNRRQFAQLSNMLGENFFDYIRQVTVWRDLDGASVELSRKAREDLSNILHVHI